MNNNHATKEYLLHKSVCGHSYRLCPIHPNVGPTCTQLLCKLPGEVEGDAPEVGVPQQIVQVVAQ